MIVGIDLGTSTSEVAFLDKDGQVVVIPNENGEVIIPSVVHIKHNGRALVGSEAKEFLFTRPESTFMEVKRLFGTDQQLTAHKKSYDSEEIQAFIIQYLVDVAAEHTGEDVSGAVITVPAYFTDVQRKQTIRAGTLAGIKVERVINEPTAAALDYGLANLEECEYILVYDFGGGTLDVTVLELFEGVIDVKSSSGNNRLGGKDFDEILMEHIAGSDYEAIAADPRSLMKLKQAAIEAKITLSEAETAVVRLPFITADISINKSVTRATFEALINPLISTTAAQIDLALADAKLSPGELNKVILVGGTTRIPAVRKFIAEKLGVEIEAKHTDSPELMVVRGAAIQAAILQGSIKDENNVVLTDVCPFTLGVIAVSEEGLKVDPLIRRNVTIPYEYSKVYTAMEEYQEMFLIEIYQGESVYPQENTRIGQLSLEKLPQRQNQLAKAEVTFSYDVNGILNVKARSLGNDNTVSAAIDINNNDLPSRPPIKLGDWEQAKNASEYRSLINEVEEIGDLYLHTPLITEGRLYIMLDDCNELKADLIFGDEEAAAKRAEDIRMFLDMWKEKEETLKEMMQRFLDKNSELDDLE